MPTASCPLSSVGRLALGVCGLALVSAGCSPYQLQGRVVEGGTPTVLIVDRDDPRLAGYGLPGAVVQATLDPDRPFQQIPLEPTTSDGEGYFAIPVTATGAGVLEYDVQIGATLAGHAGDFRTFRLPGAGKRVLIILAPAPGNAPGSGRARSGSMTSPRDELDTTTGANHDLMHETHRLGEQLSQ